MIDKMYKVNTQLWEYPHFLIHYGLIKAHCLTGIKGLALTDKSVASAFVQYSFP